MTHIAIVEQLDGRAVEWMEKVTDAQYGAPLRGQTAAAPRPRLSQAAIGDFAPKLAQITENVLYGDIWERPATARKIGGRPCGMGGTSGKTSDHWIDEFYYWLEAQGVTRPLR
jgi:hypothetical protein